jgi:hypothetical protein
VSNSFDDYYHFQVEVQQALIYYILTTVHLLKANCSLIFLRDKCYASFREKFFVASRGIADGAGGDA